MKSTCTKMPKYDENVKITKILNPITNRTHKGGVTDCFVALSRLSRGCTRRNSHLVGIDHPSQSFSPITWDLYLSSSRTVCSTLGVSLLYLDNVLDSVFYSRRITIIS